MPPPCRRQSISNDLQFLDAWNKGQVPELWAYLRARQLRRAGPAPGIEPPHPHDRPAAETAWDH